MTFEEKLELAKEFNKSLVAGKKAGEIATVDMIRNDILPEEDLIELVYLFPKWRIGIDVIMGGLYRFNNDLYEVVQSHTTQADWTPDITTSLWKSKIPDGVIGEWVQPTGSHDAYMLGDKMLFTDGLVYESTIDNNVWSPVDNPSGWVVV
jgi:hypothetical protein